MKFLFSKLLSCFIILIIFKQQVIVLTAQDLNNKFPYLYEMLEAYYSYNYEYPCNLNGLINMTLNLTDKYPNDYLDTNKILTITIPNLIKEKENLNIIKNDTLYAITFNSRTIIKISEVDYFSPCNLLLFIQGPPQEYNAFLNRYIKPRFFYNNTSIIDTELLTNQFQEDFYLLKEKYLEPYTFHYYIYENDTVPIYTFLEYKKGGDLKKFCSKKIIIDNNLYIQKMKEYLNKFCMENHVSRIIFASPESDEIR